MLIIYSILGCIVSSVFCAQINNVSVSYDASTGAFTVHSYKVDDAVAYGSFKDEIFVTGWSYLEVNSNENYPDPVQAYAAGLVEGFLTADLLQKHWNNIASDYCKDEEEFCEKLAGFLTKNLNYINEQIKDRRNRDVYWHHIALTLEQLHGLEDGFNNITSQPSTNVNVLGLLMLNIMGDLEDLEVVLKKNQVRRTLGSGSCSALVKVLPNNQDLYFSQDTWSPYNTMLRILKKYSLKFHVSMAPGSSVVPGHTCAFSSQPGTIFSGDDFYVISSGLATVETTIGNGNDSLWQYVTPYNILEWQRNIVANRLSQNGSQWATIFSMKNSGTYNNQWMIIDYNKFIPGKRLQNGLLWVLEQLPGYIHSEDVTDVLRKQSYWPSYNTAYFKDIFNMSGGQVNVEKHGDWFTYDKNPRAQIFRRDNVKVTNVDQMIKLMRYNDYTNDPLSRCNCTPPYSAENAISARCDLNPANGTYPFSALGHRNHGGTDMKMTTSEMFKKLEFVTIGGPTYDPLPPFQWSKVDFGNTVKHEGHPDLWMFKPIIHKWM